MSLFLIWGFCSSEAFSFSNASFCSLIAFFNSLNSSLTSPCVFLSTLILSLSRHRASSNSVRMRAACRANSCTSKSSPPDSRLFLSLIFLSHATTLAPAFLTAMNCTKEEFRSPKEDVSTSETFTKPEITSAEDFFPAPSFAARASFCSLISFTSTSLLFSVCAMPSMLHRMSRSATLSFLNLLSASSASASLILRESSSS
mmetsp:Transcript_41946/g.102359  ORF Transcript_41946/g.102359 Transcript_41946/m.102359 type:complete len:201 (-) Transcript_41946:883-1485(-)